MASKLATTLGAIGETVGDSSGCARIFGRALIRGARGRPVTQTHGGGTGGCCIGALGSWDLGAFRRAGVEAEGAVDGQVVNGGRGALRGPGALATASSLGLGRRCLRLRCWARARSEGDSHYFRDARLRCGRRRTLTLSR